MTVGAGGPELPPDDVLGLPMIPARQVNEFVYCPRLFHLEWVQGQFVTNADVEEGLDLHRIVDVDSGDLPSPAEDLALWAGRISRSFWVSSPTWGLTAKLDVVEIEDDGSVVPVDYKKGGPGPDGKVRDTDRAQSLVQVLLLREASYRVDHAARWSVSVCPMRFRLCAFVAQGRRARDGCSPQTQTADHSMCRNKAR